MTGNSALKLPTRGRACCCACVENFGRFGAVGMHLMASTTAIATSFDVRRSVASQDARRRWEVTVEFVRFESESKRDQAYRAWVRLFISSRLGARA